MRPDGQQQCILFAFAIATTKAAEHWSGRFSEIKILQCPKWAYVPFDFFFVPFFFFAITLLLTA